MNAIAAMDLNGVIGDQGKIPWKLKDDLRFFKEMTSNPVSGGHVIMGNSTYKQVGDLPNRFIYILTRDELLLNTPETDKHKYITLDYIDDKNIPLNQTWVAGGAKVYEQLLKQCKNLYLTIVLNEYEGDTFFPLFNDLFPESDLIIQTNKYWIVQYRSNSLFNND